MNVETQPNPAPGKAKKRSSLAQRDNQRIAEVQGVSLEFDWKKLVEELNTAWSKCRAQFIKIVLDTCFEGDIKNFEADGKNNERFARLRREEGLEVPYSTLMNILYVERQKLELGDLAEGLAFSHQKALLGVKGQAKKDLALRAASMTVRELETAIQEGRKKKRSGGDYKPRQAKKDLERARGDVMKLTSDKWQAAFGKMKPAEQQEAIKELRTMITSLTDMVGSMKPENDKDDAAPGASPSRPAAKKAA